VADLVVVFQAVEELERASRALRAAGAPFRTVEPPAALADVAVPYLVISDESRAALHAILLAGTVMAGQVWYRAPLADALADLGPQARPGAEDLVGRLAIAFVAPCTAEEDHLRLTAQVEGDLGPAMPYLNAVLRGGTFNRQGPTFTFMDGPRLINLFPHRASIARAREMQDAWRSLARLKRTVNEIWSRRGAITPCYVRRVQISAIEIYSRLPRTNCRECGEATCLAFAAKLLNGLQRLENCKPVFSGAYEHLRQALLDAAVGAGV
jgi:ArsR family metal-binding transcriptional regulator